MLGTNLKGQEVRLPAILNSFKINTDRSLKLLKRLASGTAEDARNFSRVPIPQIEYAQTHIPDVLVIFPFKADVLEVVFACLV